MKIEFPLPTDSKYHQYCCFCHSEAVERIYIDKKTFYKCKTCNKLNSRMIVVDPKIVSWVDAKTKEYWHESVGIFLNNGQNKILLYERIIYPFSYTIPSGHLDVDEDPRTAILRELKEETNILLEDIQLISDENVLGDQCRRGADNHKWHLFKGTIKKATNIVMNDEGINPIWYSLDEALKKELTYPVKYFIEMYNSEIFS